VTVPLTAGHSYEEFIRGLRPIRRNGSSKRRRHPKNCGDLSEKGKRRISSL
jgi:hypothetical protein